MSKPHDDKEMQAKLEHKAAHSHVGTEAAAVVSGAAIGALAGAVAGPVGAMAGAVIGGAAGAVAGLAFDRTEGQHDADDREIDKIEADAEAVISRRGPSMPPSAPEKTWEEDVEESLRDPKA